MDQCSGDPAVKLVPVVFQTHEENPALLNKDALVGDVAATGSKRDTLRDAQGGFSDSSLRCSEL
jgi:hypothetical protein